MPRNCKTCGEVFNDFGAICKACKRAAQGKTGPPVNSLPPNFGSSLPAVPGQGPPEPVPLTRGWTDTAAPVGEVHDTRDGSPQAPRMSKVLERATTSGAAPSGAEVPIYTAPPLRVSAAAGAALPHAAAVPTGVQQQQQHQQQQQQQQHHRPGEKVKDEVAAMLRDKICPERILAEATPAAAIAASRAGDDPMLGFITLSDEEVDRLVDNASVVLKQSIKDRNVLARAESLLKHAGAGNSAAMRSLLDAGAEAKLGTLLASAGQQGHAEVATMLLERRADVEAVHGDGVALLHAACRSGHEGVAQVLLEARANVKAVDNAGLMPLHIASEGGHVALAKVLIRAGANVHAVAGVLGEPTFQSTQGRPDVGDHVKILPAHGRQAFQNKEGKVIVSDRSAKPFGVEFDDGKSAWFAEADVSKMEMVVDASSRGSAYGAGTPLEIAQRTRNDALRQVLQGASIGALVQQCSDEQTF